MLDGIRTRVRDSPAYFSLLGELRSRRGEKQEAAEAYRASIEHLGLSARRYACAACNSVFESWEAVCSICGTFGLIELQIELETQRVPDQPLYDRPTWPVYGNEDEN